MKHCLGVLDGAIRYADDAGIMLDEFFFPLTDSNKTAMVYSSTLIEHS